MSCANSSRRTATTRVFTTNANCCRPILDGAGILYVVDGSRPYGREYEPEMEVLRWTGRPRMALINLIAKGDHVDEWRAALSQFFSIVRVFDAMHADFSRRIELLRAFGAIDETWSPRLNQAADALTRERAQRKERAATEIADLLIAVLTTTESAALPDEHPDPAIEEAGARAAAQNRQQSRTGGAPRGSGDLSPRRSAGAGSGRVVSDGRPVFAAQLQRVRFVVRHNWR